MGIIPRLDHSPFLLIPEWKSPVQFAFAVLSHAPPGLPRPHLYPYPKVANLVPLTEPFLTATGLLRFCHLGELGGAIWLLILVGRVEETVDRMWVFLEPAKRLDQMMSVDTFNDITTRFHYQHLGQEFRFLVYKVLTNTSLSCRWK